MTMETKHTMGPWSYERDDKRIIFGPAGYAVGEVDCDDVDHDVALADARLIAAAPELLAEHQNRVSDLTLLRRAIDEGDPKAELLLRIDDMLRDTRAAISKATGEG